jgi:transposase
MEKFIGADREQQMLMPYDLGNWLPEDHLARFIVGVVDKLNFNHIYLNHKGIGSTAYDPRMLLSLLFYGYSTGIFSSCKIERSSYDSIAFHFITSNHQPDHDTKSNFRKRFLPEIKTWFKEILLIGKELGIVKLGNIYIDGAMVQANASRHKAMSYEYIQKMEKQLGEEIEKLLSFAITKDESEKDLELNIPEETKRREDRLSKIQEAKKTIEQRASERYQKEKEEYDAKMSNAKRRKKRQGKSHEARIPI